MDKRDLYNKRCRLCACEASLSITLFSEEGRVCDIITKIDSYLGFKVSRNDGLPQLVCYQCMYNIESFHTFKRKCSEAEHVLKNWSSFFEGKNPDEEIDLQPEEMFIEDSSDEESDQEETVFPVEIQEETCTKRTTYNTGSNEYNTPVRLSNERMTESTSKITSLNETYKNLEIYERDVNDVNTIAPVGLKGSPINQIFDNAQRPTNQSKKGVFNNKNSALHKKRTSMRNKSLQRDNEKNPEFGMQKTQTVEINDNDSPTKLIIPDILTTSQMLSNQRGVESVESEIEMLEVQILDIQNTSPLKMTTALRKRSKNAKMEMDERNVITGNKTQTKVEMAAKKRNEITGNESPTKVEMATKRKKENTENESPTKVEMAAKKRNVITGNKHQIQVEMIEEKRNGITGCENETKGEIAAKKRNKITGNETQSKQRSNTRALARHSSSLSKQHTNVSKKSKFESKNSSNHGKDIVANNTTFEENEKNEDRLLITANKERHEAALRVLRMLEDDPDVEFDDESVTEVTHDSNDILGAAAKSKTQLNESASQTRVPSMESNVKKERGTPNKEIRGKPSSSGKNGDVNSPFELDMQLGTRNAMESYSVENHKPKMPIIVRESLTPHESKLMEKVTTESGRIRYRCYVCEKTFAAKQYVKEHMKIHSGERPSKCSICSKAFRNRYIVRAHMITHQQVRKYKCSVCGNLFKAKINLKDHMLTHSDKRPFVCELCGSTFKQQAGLNRHTRCHTGQKPYSCKFCGRGFPDYSGVVRHIRTHTGERPYQCAICKASFIQKSGLKLHIASHHDTLPFAGQLCPEKFKTKMHVRKQLSWVTVCPKCPTKLHSKVLLTEHLKNVHKIEQVSDKVTPKYEFSDHTQ